MGDDEELFREAIKQHALTLGMNPEVDEDLLWIAEESLTADLPPGTVKPINSNHSDEYVSPYNSQNTYRLGSTRSRKW